MGRSAVFARSLLPRGQAGADGAVLESVGTNRSGTRRAAATTATALFLTTFVLLSGVGAQGDPAADPMYDDTYDDPYYDDAYYDEICDPAFHPDWESDPYCNPALYDDPTFTDGTSSPTVLAFATGRSAWIRHRPRWLSTPTSTWPTSSSTKPFESAPSACCSPSTLSPSSAPSNDPSCRPRPRWCETSGTPSLPPA